MHIHTHPSERERECGTHYVKCKNQKRFCKSPNKRGIIFSAPSNNKKIIRREQLKFDKKHKE
jgi:hypothetical protein